MLSLTTFCESAGYALMSIYVCKLSRNHYFIGVMYGYKGCLLVIGLFLAYETRSVKIRKINDLRFVAMAVYNVVVSQHVP